MSYLDTVNDKRQQTQTQNQQQAEFAAMIRQFQQVQAAVMAGSSKPSVVLTDQTDLGDKMGELATKLAEAVKSIDTTQLTKDQTKELKDLNDGLSDVLQAIRANAPDNADVVRAIKGLDLNVNVEAPVIKVDAPQVDLKPLNDTLKAYFEAPKPEDDKVDMDDYKAHDLTDSGDMQYVGFVNPVGNWYIIENDVKGGTMRYVFGTKGYAKAFRKAATFKYYLLNEAVANAS